jgi:NAD(P)-dependent dehydrogenase (short-subunit alcohol dehydrogenase family)
VRINDGAALVTGGASGLGRATTEALLDAGARVVILDLPGSPGAELADRLGARFGDAVRFAPGDVRAEDDVAAALDVADGLGPLRVAVNCAGTGNAIRILSKRGVYPLAEFTRIVEINLIGTFNVIRLSAERMARHDPVGEERGVIVNTASVAAFDGQIGQAAYSAAKAGIAGMTLPIARDLATQRIRVVTIAPGLFDTPPVQAAPRELRDSLGAQVPHPARLGDPTEFAALVGHIVANPMLNGEVIRLDGAIRMSPR